MVTFENMMSLLILKHFNIFHCIHYINDLPENKNINLNIPYPYLKQNNTRITSKTVNTTNCEGFVIISENLEEHIQKIETHLRYQHRKTYRYTSRRYLLVSATNLDVEQFLGLDIFRFIRDLLLLVPVGCDDTYYDFCEAFTFWTHKFVGRDHQSAVLLDTWKVNNEFYSEKLFPDKISNMHGRILNVSTVNFIPFVNTHTNRGNELSLVESIAKQYNFTTNFTESKQSWGSVIDDYMGYGSRYYTAIGDTDISIGGMYGTIESLEHLEMSLDTVRSFVTYLVPGQIIDLGFTTPLRPFSKQAWLLVGIFFLLVCVAYYIFVNYYQRLHQKNIKLNNNVIFSIYCIFMSQQANVNLRVYGTFVFLSAILITSFYSSGLASQMAKPSYKNGIKTLADLEKATVTIATTTLTEIDVMQAEPGFTSMINRTVLFNVSTLPSLATKIKYEPYAIALELLLKWYSLGPFEDYIDVHDIEEYRCMKEYISNQLCVIIGYKHSVYIPVINKHLLEVKEAGLMYYWLDIAFRDMNYTYRRYFEKESTYNTVKLNWKNVQGTFLLLGIGLGISILRFIWEMYMRFKKAKEIE